MDDFGNSFDSEQIQFQINDLIGGIGRYWMFFFSGCGELTRRQSFYYDLLVRGEPMPHY